MPQVSEIVLTGSHKEPRGVPPKDRSSGLHVPRREAGSDSFLSRERAFGLSLVSPATSAGAECCSRFYLSVGPEDPSHQDLIPIPLQDAYTSQKKDRNRKKTRMRDPTPLLRPRRPRPDPAFPAPDPGRARPSSPALGRPHSFRKRPPVPDPPPQSSDLRRRTGASPEAPPGTHPRRTTPPTDRRDRGDGPYRKRAGRTPRRSPPDATTRHPRASSA